MAKVLKWAIFSAVVAGVLLGSAGRWYLPAFWLYIIAFSGLTLWAMMTIDDPGLAAERRRPGPGGVDSQLRFAAPPLVLAHCVVAGLDVGRFHWSDIFPSSVQLVGLLAFAAGLRLTYVSMAANTFFSPVVRLQKERGHHVITRGPYKHVRHPGYLGMMVAYLASGLALGSVWSMVPALGLVLLFLRRAAIEDRFLQEQLDGYRDYAQTVPYRLVPGVW